MGVGFSMVELEKTGFRAPTKGADEGALPTVALGNRPAH